MCIFYCFKDGFDFFFFSHYSDGYPIGPFHASKASWYSLWFHTIFFWPKYVRLFLKMTFSFWNQRIEMVEELIQSSGITQLEKSLNVRTKVKISKKKLYFFSLNLFSIPRDIPWHHWKNLLTSKRGRSGALNFFTKFAQI